MKTRIIIIMCFAVLFLSARPLSIFAEESIFPIQVKQYKDISYINGGIGSDERKTLLRMGKAYGLKLMFAVESGAYIANVNVIIRNKSGGEILEVPYAGPWFYADLPPGHYTVSATALSKTLEKIALVKNQGQIEIRFFWKK